MPETGVQSKNAQHFPLHVRPLQDEMQAPPRSGHPQFMPGHEIDRQMAGIINMISFCVYSIMIFLLLRKHRKNISEYLSYTSVGHSLSWLRWITICFVIAYSFVFLSIQFAPGIYRHPMLDPRWTPDFGTTFFIFTFCFFAVHQPVIYKRERPEEAPPEGDSSEKNMKNPG